LGEIILSQPIRNQNRNSEQVTRCHPFKLIQYQGLGSVAPSSTGGTILCSTCRACTCILYATQLTVPADAGDWNATWMINSVCKLITQSCYSPISHHAMKLKIPPRLTYRLPHLSRYFPITPFTISNLSRFCSASAYIMSNINQVGRRNTFILVSSFILCFLNVK
jgi:hypothetical protein